MAEVKWIKITTDIFDDDKILLIETLPEADSIIVIWFKLLCLAGKQNNSGVFLLNDRIAYTDKMLASIFRRKESTVQLALETFERFGMIELVDGVITIPNWGKHQNLDALEKKTAYMREYMKDYRQKQKLLAASQEDKTNCKSNSKANVSCADKNRLDKNRLDIDIPPYNPPKGERDVAFDEFWKAYPKKVGKADARKAFGKAIKTVDLDTILQAIEVQKESDQWSRDNGKYIPNPSTWLNQGRWDDELAPRKRSPLYSETFDNDAYWDSIVVSEELIP